MVLSVLRGERRADSFALRHPRGVERARKLSLYRLSDPRPLPLRRRVPIRAITPPPWVGARGIVVE